MFTTGKLFICNDAEKEPNFYGAMDNQPKVRNVFNFMIGPVYGEDKKHPIGVIQFINKNEGIIDDRDVARFEEISELIGMCIENTNTITKTVGVTFQFAAVMEKINNIMKE